MWNELGISGGTAIIILIALYYVIKWAVKNGIKEAYRAITGEKTDEDIQNEEELKELALKENIRLAAVQALGATNSFTVGVYNVAEKQYYANTFSGSFEIVSLTGTINTMNGAFYTHLHMSAGNDKGEVFGGHLNRAVVSATCEMVVDVLDGTVDRQYDPITGLNLFKF